ncbi:PD-(D/E)XK nuclease family protein [Chloroflexota bacterium]
MLFKKERRRTIKPLSFTQISLYRSCPLCYKLQYIDGLKSKDKWQFSFGTTMHHCVEYFFRVSAPPPPPLNELLQFYEQNWLSKGYESADEETKYRVYGRDILAKFWDIHNADFQMPVAVERMFYIDIEGVKLRGFIDRVDKLERGELSIVDYKTNKELFTVDDLEKDLQLTLYQLAAEQIWQLPVGKLTLYHLRSNTPCSCQPREKARLEQAKNLVLEVADNIANKRFPATENQYCPCDFPEHCPYYRQKYAAATPQAPRQEVLPGIAAADAVERYVALQEQIKELQLELDEAKQLIIGFCQSEGLNRIFGTEHAITYKLLERTGFSEDEARAILEPIGLWGRVLSLDKSRLKQLQADESVAEDIKKKLENLKQVISTYPQLWAKRLVEEE